MTRNALMQTAAAPAKARMVAGAVGDATSSKAMTRMAEAVAALKAQAMMPILQQALAEVTADHHQQAAELALKALEIDEECAVAWRVLAVAREKAQDYVTALKCYEKAFQLTPEETELANDLGRLAYAMGMKDEAEALFAHFYTQRPDSPDAANNLACCQRDRMMFGDAVDTLRPAIEMHPSSAMLWNTLGTVMVELGEMEQSLIFFDEALAQDPEFAKARYNRGNARLAMGEVDTGLLDCDEAIAGTVLESEKAMMQLARASMLIAKGELAQGWEAYEIRLDPNYADVTHFICEAGGPWTPDADLDGKHLLLFGEQGLGDEVLFASMLPDVLKALGPEGRLALAVEPRLVELFQQSYPEIEVGPHRTGKTDTGHVVRIAPFMTGRDDIDYWAPIASLLRRFRPSVEAYPARDRFLHADPARIAHWKGLLAELGPGPKVGVLWKSLKVDSGRHRYFSPFEAWKPVLQTPGAVFVNLQYGDCAEELERARTELGVEIWSPPGIDLKDDLADLAALCCALDLTVGPANATTNIAAAAGAPVWLISTPGAWPRLGTDRYPWYPQVRVFQPEAYNSWDGVMAELATAISELSRTS